MVKSCACECSAHKKYNELLYFSTHPLPPCHMHTHPTPHMHALKHINAGTTRTSKPTHHTHMHMRTHQHTNTRTTRTCTRAHHLCKKAKQRTPTALDKDRLQFIHENDVRRSDRKRLSQMSTKGKRKNIEKG